MKQAIHIYRERAQPATRWIELAGQPDQAVIWPDNKLLWCGCCGKTRRAKNCVVQSYYDGLYVWCAPGKGCKDPKAIQAKKRREFRNRSRGQKARYAGLAVRRHLAAIARQRARPSQGAERIAWRASRLIC
jgi:hypothetical protein